MPKLLALGGPRDGYLVHIDDGADDLSFELAPAFPADEMTVARYRRARVAGEDVLVSDALPAGADLESLHRAAQEKQRAGGQWADDTD